MVDFQLFTIGRKDICIFFWQCKTICLTFYPSRGTAEEEAFSVRAQPLGKSEVESFANKDSPLIEQIVDGQIYRT